LLIASIAESRASLLTVSAQRSARRVHLGAHRAHFGHDIDQPADFRFRL
jgi:hypothetical protein